MPYLLFSSEQLYPRDTSPRIWRESVMLLVSGGCFEFINFTKADEGHFLCFEFDRAFNINPSASDLHYLLI